jgi:hypothetical protein
MKTVGGRLLLHFAIILAALGALWVMRLPARNQAWQTSCASNLKQLALAASAYAADYDGRYPLKPRPGGDWMAFEWGTFPIRVMWRRGYHLQVLEPGPVFSYVKNACMAGCPSDPARFRRGFRDHPRSSYEWNDALCGKIADEVKGQWLVRDREPWHGGRRNVAGTRGRVGLVD